MHYLSLLKLMHLSGLIMGVGGAVMVDVVMLRHAVLKPVSRYALLQARLLGRVVAVGLFLLWISGATLVWVHALIDPNSFNNPKLLAKIIMVAALTLNGFAIWAVTMPRLEQQFGRGYFDRTTPKDHAILTFIASFSTVSWLSVFVLSSAHEVDRVFPVWKILANYGIALLAGWALLYLFAAWISREQRTPVSRTGINGRTAYT
jgi:hypothetical protein